MTQTEIWRHGCEYTVHAPNLLKCIECAVVHVLGLLSLLIRTRLAQLVDTVAELRVSVSCSHIHL